MNKSFQGVVTGYWELGKGRNFNPSQHLSQFSIHATLNSIKPKEIKK